MFTLDFSDLHRVAAPNGISEMECAAMGTRLPTYLERIAARDQDFYKIVNDDNMVLAALDFAKRVSEKFRDIVVLGIGGSSLGTICIRDTLSPLFAPARVDRSTPRLHVLDNIDPCFISNLEDLLDLKQTLFLVVTKSGSTPETLAQYFYFLDRCRAASLNEKEHFVFVTDAENGVLRQIATDDLNASENPFVTFPVPEKVGGRFSVLTSVGLVPAALMGVDIEKIMAGARAMRDLFLSERFEDNLPFQLATAQYLANKPMHVLFAYSQRLISLADWYRQLLAESLGKTPEVGLTPLFALGATDQHSQLQLYSDGPNDKFFMFMNIENNLPTLKIPSILDPAMSYLSDLAFDTLLDTERRGTIQALVEKNRPTLSISIPTLDAFTLGALFMLFEGSVAFLGEFYGINAFDQPGVERSKVLTKAFLNS